MCGVPPRYIIAYSCGSPLLATALARLRARHPGDGHAELATRYRLGNVIFVASDVDRKTFARDYVPPRLDLSEQLIVYVSRKDRALGFSNLIADASRLGKPDIADLTPRDLERLAADPRLQVGALSLRHPIPPARGCPRERGAQPESLAHAGRLSPVRGGPAAGGVPRAAPLPVTHVAKSRARHRATAAGQAYIHRTSRSLRQEEPNAGAAVGDRRFGASRWMCASDDADVDLVTTTGGTSGVCPELRRLARSAELLRIPVRLLSGGIGRSGAYGPPRVWQIPPRNDPP